ncbi:LOW QUALITY PROTEIN: hypothetical protein PHMEG_00025313 [Phytophthora megakarya]|uniref:Integrase catalytic domain-containing protein n=1 Tax=Phytophthora megakarya TaxID=4795 RepID=A0A225VDZ4_9STRA|nr:LOW QUALITY PROTEIN: hypothetical protein PHMEG_00025313 [Phytophthora megakarya]
MLRSLPTQTCYNELRRKVLISSDTSKYTPAIVREMVLTAEARSKDWDNNAFGNGQSRKKNSNGAGSQKETKKQESNEELKKKTPNVDWFHCGGFKRAIVLISPVKKNRAQRRVHSQSTLVLVQSAQVRCMDCQFGKQKRKTYRKQLERNIEKVNDMVFTDLLIPGVHNKTHYTAVLVVMDGYSRFVTTSLLKSRNEDEVNARMQEYIAWAERQHGRRVEKVVTRKIAGDGSEETSRPVKQVLTDKGQEFCNGTMER